MEIIEFTAKGVLERCRIELGLQESDSIELDNAMLASLLRRAAGFLCPCSPSTLASNVTETLQYLGYAHEELTEKIDATIENLIVGGDLLELSQVSIDEVSAKGTWIFIAPPAFVSRRNGNLIITGLAPDEVTPLPSDLKMRIKYDGVLRIIEEQKGERLAAAIQELGFIELSEQSWLKTPKNKSAKNFLDSMTRRLDAQPGSGSTDDIEILNPISRVEYYRGRWVRPRSETGKFIARRPQMYGAPIWGYASFENGTLEKFLDFPLKNTRWRGCDIAWHLQMAIDYLRGLPQLYRIRPSNDGNFVDFFSPVPLWAQRRLTLFGRQAPRHKSLFSFLLPKNEMESEELFLQNHLWLSRIDKAE